MPWGARSERTSTHGSFQERSHPSIVDASMANAHTRLETTPKDISFSYYVQHFSISNQNDIYGNVTQLSNDILISDRHEPDVSTDVIRSSALRPIITHRGCTGTYVNLNMVTTCCRGVV